MVRGAAIAPLFLREKHRTGVGLENMFALKAAPSLKCQYFPLFSHTNFYLRVILINLQVL